MNRGRQSGREGSHGARGDRRREARGAGKSRGVRRAGSARLVVIRPGTPAPAGTGGSGAGAAGRPAAGAARGAPAGRPHLVPIPGKGGRRGARGRRLLALGGLLGLFAAVVIALMLRALPAESPATVPVRRGPVELAIAGPAVVVRDEFVQVAPRDGPLARLVEEGRAVRVGTPVVRVGAGVAAVPVVAEVPGTVSFDVDGLETELRPSALPWLGAAAGDVPGPAWLERLPLRRLDPPREAVREGEPVFKIVDGSRVWLVVPAEAEPLRFVGPGERLRVELADIGSAVHFTVSGMSAGDGRRLLVLKADEPVPDRLLLVRRTSVRSVLRRWTGLVVPRESLTHQGGQLGVWVEEAGRSRFVPVRVLGQGPEGAVVEGELREGQPVRVPRGTAGPDA